ncbi:UNVERIFIED_CONTAM: hypothetical protein Sindi_0933500 [Sesamum indicum]
MSSGAPLVPCGRGCGSGRGPPPPTQDDARPSGAALAAATPAAPPPPPVSHHELANISALMMRGLTAASLTSSMQWCGDTFPTRSHMTYWWDCDDESMFRSSTCGRNVHPEDILRRPVEPGQATLASQRGLPPTRGILSQRGFSSGVLEE